MWFIVLLFFKPEHLLKHFVQIKYFRNFCLKVRYKKYNIIIERQKRKKEKKKGRQGGREGKKEGKGGKKL